MPAPYPLEFRREAVELLDKRAGIPCPSLAEPPARALQRGLERRWISPTIDPQPPVHPLLVGHDQLDHRRLSELRLEPRSHTHECR